MRRTRRPRRKVLWRKRRRAFNPDLDSIPDDEDEDDELLHEERLIGTVDKEA